MKPSLNKSLLISAVSLAIKATKDNPMNDEQLIEDLAIVEARERILVAEIERLTSDRDSWLEQAMDRLKDWDEMRQESERLRAHAIALAEVMAFIHGDGGHYLAKHGPIKAAQDAAEKYVKLLAEIERLRGLCVRAHAYLEGYEDQGPVGYGWQSDELKAFVKELYSYK